MQLVVGGGAAAISRTAVAPLSRVKTLLQVWPQPLSQVVSARTVAESTARALASPLPMSSLGIKSRGWRAVARAMWRADGALGFWRGNGTNVLRILPTAAINHALFPWWKHRLAGALGVSTEGASSLGLFLLRTGAGTMSVGCTLAVLYPLELARTRLTCDVAMTNGRRTYGGIIDCLASTARAEGLGALYKGFGVSASAVLPMLVVSHATFDSLRQVLLAGRGGKDDAWATVARVGIGAVAALAAQVAVYPLDTVRRRLQLDGSSALHDGPIATVGSRAGHSALHVTPEAAPVRPAPHSIVEAAARAVTDPLPESIRHRLPASASELVEPIRARLRLPPWLSGWSATTLHRPKYGGSPVACFRRIVAEEGWYALYRGIVPQAVKTFPAAIVQFCAYALLLRAVSTELR